MYVTPPRENQGFEAVRLLYLHVPCAWLAYLAWRKATEALQLQPVDGFTPDQRFFVGMAQWACENTRPEDERLMAATNPHSPGRYRINGVVSNLPEFAKAFSCKAGDPMVRAEACRIW